MEGGSAADGENSAVAGTPDDAAGTEAVQALEAAFRKVKPVCRLRVSRLFVTGDRLVIRIAHEDAGKARREREDVLAAVAA